MINYYYTKLNKTAQSYYGRMYESFRNYKDTCQLRVTNNNYKDDIPAAWEAVLWDHSELFYLGNKYSYTGSFMGASFTSKFVYNKNEIDEYSEKIDQILFKMKKDLENKDIEEVLEYLMNYYLATTRYEVDFEKNQCAASVFIFHKSQCSGYSQATNLILRFLGFDSIVVVGEGIDEEVGTSGGHAWNMIKIDGKYYHFDATFSLTLNLHGKVFSNKKFFSKK